MKTYIYPAFFIIFLILVACNQQSKLDDELPASSQTISLEINPDLIVVEGDLGSFELKKEAKTVDGVQFITFRFNSVKPAELQPISIKFDFPSVDINGFWNPGISADKVNYYSSRITSKASRYAPILSFYNNALQNRMTISLSDALNQSEIISYLKEEDVRFHPRIKLFDEKMPKTTSYEITLRIDTRVIPYHKAIDDVANWWVDFSGYRPMIVPDNAKKPMYSTWYSYHQNITTDEIVTECKIAKSLGCEAVIVDDGWQTKDGNRGYAYTGDWKPERIGDMKAFVDAVHAEGMQFILWYSLPFIGENAENYPRFKGKYLRYWDGQGAYVLDPRYPDVREFIINTYIKAMQEWNLDGFKLDFIGRFTAVEDTRLTKENGRDFASVNEATDALMTEVTNRLTALKPDILIEFRQPYIGPLMRKYGNMFRGVDAPNNAVANRVETTNLRIMSQNTAVHSDMFIWRIEEPVESAALQILNILYSVPQLSVRLEEIPETHLSMIRYWFDYWNKHRNILLDGEFMPSNPVSNYPILTAIADCQQITTVYEDMIVRPESNLNHLDLINAKASTKIGISMENAANAHVKISDCTGKVILEKETELAKGIQEISVPASGMISIDFK